MNNNQIRKFKVGSLYRNDRHPKALYLCVADVDSVGDKDRFTKKSLVVLEATDGCKGHIVASDAVKNWKWREV